MRQLALDLQLPEPFGFDDFLIGPNLEVFTCLKDLADDRLPEKAAYLWGEAGVGKTHLLRATVARASEAGLHACYWDAALEPLGEMAHGYDLLAVDHIERLDQDGQVVMFGLYNAQRERGCALVAAGELPPARLPLRDDLQTRLGWGLVFHVEAPADEDKAALLRHRARVRGCEIGEEVCRYLVTHTSRDLGSLTRLIDRLDHAALAAQRPLTLPFVREALKRDELE
ncbi:DnaA regulatory inactivator Hda [Chitinimonas lacunae]|uniref:DnaA regulatory inactivator Hda n=1 Tax=Chitinimonas lacunae TaxID=1963018 RepID=A0ABV8MPN4_9NEIS